MPKKSTINTETVATTGGMDLDDLLGALDLDEGLPSAISTDRVSPEPNETTENGMWVADIIEPTTEQTDLSDLLADVAVNVTPTANTQGGRAVKPAVSGASTTYVDPIELLIKDVGDVPEYITVVGYGKNGTGKTTFGASGDGTLVLEVEKDGTFSVRDRGSKAKKLPIKSWDEFEKVYWYLKANCSKYKILCIDTLTRLLDLCIREVVLGEKAKDTELMDKDVIKVTLPQRGDIAQKMKYWLKAIQELPIHKVWLCQESSGSDDADVAEFDVYPDLSRSIRTYVCSDATVIGRMMIKHKKDASGAPTAEKPLFLFVTKPSEKWLSKDRTNVLGDYTVNAKIDEIIEKIYK